MTSRSPTDPAHLKIMEIVRALDSGVWWIGFVSVASAVVRFTLWAHRHFYRPAVDLAVRYGGGESGIGWCVVTGGSSGIGFEMVLRLLESGFKIVVVALPHEERAFIRRLKTKGLELCVREQRCVFVGVDAADGATAAVEVHDVLDERVPAGQLRLLVHCIGAPTATPKPLWDHTTDEVQRLINVNLGFAGMLTAAALPGMLKGSGRKGVVFMSSLAGAMPSSPLISCYGAAKAGLISLAGSLSVELAHAHPDVDVLVAMPGRTLAGSTLNWWSEENAWNPGTFATPTRIASDTLDHLDAGPKMSPYWVHSLQLMVSRMLPDFVLGELVYRDLSSALPVTE